MNSVEYTARLLFKAVKKASINYTDINKGDRIAVTGANDDVEGIVTDIDTGKDTTTITLDTGANKEILQISSENFIHIIQRADMLNMRDHTKYERGLEDTDKSTHKLTEKDQRPEYGPDEKSDKSTLPASKISLMMKTKR